MVFHRRLSDSKGVDMPLNNKRNKQIKIPENLMHLIFQFVYIPFVSMVKFSSLAHFSVDHFSYPVMQIFCVSLQHSLIKWLSHLCPHITYTYCSVADYYYYYYYYHYYFTSWKFFTPALAGDISHEFEWQQVSSGFKDSSQYSSRS